MSDSEQSASLKSTRGWRNSGSDAGSRRRLVSAYGNVSLTSAISTGDRGADVYGSPSSTFGRFGRKTR